MKTIAFTDFRKKASDLITEVEHGETIILLRRGKPVAEVVPFSDTAQENPGMEAIRNPFADPRKRSLLCYLRGT